MRPKNSWLIFLVLIISLMLLSANTFAKAKRGATVTIEKNEGGIVKGELVAVRSNSILVLTKEGLEEKDETVDLSEIRVIRLKRQSTVGSDIFTCTFSATGGWFIGSMASQFFPDPYTGKIDFDPDWADIGKTTAIAAGAGFVLGTIIAIARTTSFRYQIGGMNSVQIEKTLKKLRKHARTR